MDGAGWPVEISGSLEQEGRRHWVRVITYLILLLRDRRRRSSWSSGSSCSCSEPTRRQGSRSGRTATSTVSWRPSGASSRRSSSARAMRRRRSGLRHLGAVRHDRVRHPRAGAQCADQVVVPAAAHVYAAERRELRAQADEEMRASLGALATTDATAAPQVATSPPLAPTTAPPPRPLSRRHRRHRRRRRRHRRRRRPDRLAPGQRSGVGQMLAAQAVEPVRVADLGVTEPHGHQQGPRHLDELGT